MNTIIWYAIIPLFFLFGLCISTLIRTKELEEKIKEQAKDAERDKELEKIRNKIKELGLDLKVEFNGFDWVLTESEEGLGLFPRIYKLCKIDLEYPYYTYELLDYIKRLKDEK